MIFILALACLGALAVPSGCTPVALQPVTSTGLVVYSMGARQNTASLRLSLPPDQVYQGMLEMLERRPHVSVINRNDKRYLLEVDDRGRQLTGQATDLGRGETLLFIWVDAGETGQTGQDLMQDVITTVCAELRVECEVQDI
ncbi:MAG: hypothetical protein JSU82_05435 [Rhodospirillales bacterium]|nr:MAG: hypothetical protein JSU82_05435 [Rhodospirillales bacterium]